MSKGLLFWIVFILSVLFYFGMIFWPDAPYWRGNAVHAVEFLLIGLLGWKTFGQPIHD